MSHNVVEASMFTGTCHSSGMSEESAHKISQSVP